MAANWYFVVRLPDSLHCQCLRKNLPVKNKEKNYRKKTKIKTHTFIKYNQNSIACVAIHRKQTLHVILIFLHANGLQIPSGRFKDHLLLEISINETHQSNNYTHYFFLFCLKRPIAYYALKMDCFQRQTLNLADEVLANKLSKNLL